MILTRDGWDISWVWSYSESCRFCCSNMWVIALDSLTGNPSQTLNGRQRRTQAKLQDSRSFRVLDEPAAAVLAFGLGETGSESSLTSSFTISVEVHLMYLPSLSKEGVLGVLATARDTHLRGQDFDNRVIYYLVKAYDKRKLGGKLVATNALWANQRRPRNLWNAHGRCRVVEIDNFENGKDFSETLTRAKFEEVTLGVV